MRSTYLAALDIGGTKIAATIAHKQGILARVAQPTVKSGPVHALGEQALQLIQEACVQAGVLPKRIAALGVSSCGPFAKSNNQIELVTPNICGGLSHRSDRQNDWCAIPLEKILGSHFKSYAIKNDCMAGLIAERTFGAVRNEMNCAYVTWSTGIGFAFCVDGHMVEGKNGNAGHAGHMLMDPSSHMLCGCGNQGDLEALVSGYHLEYQSGLSASELFTQARQSETKAAAIIDIAISWFSRALYNIAITLDTKIFVIGGSIGTHHGAWLAPQIEHAIGLHFPTLTQGITVVRAALSTHVTDIGALCLVMPNHWIALWRTTQPWQVSHLAD